MTKCAVLLLGLLVALLVAPGAVFAQSGGSPMDIYPFCQQGAVSAPCNCNVFDWQDNGYIEPGCYCHENMDFCVNEPGVIVWSHSDYPTNTPTAVSTPEFITATPRSNQEQFDKLPNGCPDWSQLGPGTSTPGPNDVSADYAMRCRGCLAGSSTGGLNLPTPITGPIRTPAGMRVEVPGAYDWYLASSLSAFFPEGREVSGGKVEARWPADVYDFLLGRDVIGALLTVESVVGLESCNIRFEEIVGPARAWVSSSQDTYCFGPKWICDELAPDGLHQFSGIARPDMNYGIRSVVEPKEFYQTCDGTMTYRVDLILRDHIDDGGIQPPIIGATRTPTPEHTYTPSPSPEPVRVYFTEPLQLGGGSTARIIDDGLAVRGTWLTKKTGNGQNLYQSASWRIGMTSTVPVTSFRLLLRPVGADGLPTDNWEGCPVSATSVWRPLAKGSGWAYDRSAPIPAPGGGWYFDYSKWPDKPTSVGGDDNTIRNCDSHNWPVAFFSWELRVVAVDGYPYEVPVTPTPTPGPSPTPVIDGTPAPLPGGSGYIGDNCDVVEWRSQDEKSGKDVLEWEWSGWTSEPECYVIVPEINETIPLDKIPLLHLDAVDVSWPGFELCVMWIEFPKVTLLGFTVSLDWFLLPLVAGLIGLIIRS